MHQIEVEPTLWYDQSEGPVECECGREWILSSYPHVLQCDCGTLLAERRVKPQD